MLKTFSATEGPTLQVPTYNVQLDVPNEGFYLNGKSSPPHPKKNERKNFKKTIKISLLLPRQPTLRIDLP